MIWKGRELRSPDEIVQPMYRLTDPDEAQEFVAAYREAYPSQNWQRDLGYLTGYMPESEGERVRQLLGVEHPVIGDLERPLSVRDLFELGAAFQEAHLRGLDFDAAAAEARDAVRALRIISNGRDRLMHDG